MCQNKCHSSYYYWPEPKRYSQWVHIFSLHPGWAQCLCIWTIHNLNVRRRSIVESKDWIEIRYGPTVWVIFLSPKWWIGFSLPKKETKRYLIGGDWIIRRTLWDPCFVTLTSAPSIRNRDRHSRDLIEIQCCGTVWDSLLGSKRLIRFSLLKKQRKRQSVSQGCEGNWIVRRTLRNPFFVTLMSAPSVNLWHEPKRF